MAMKLEATTEAMASARHYSGMRFNMMAAFFILCALLVNAFINRGSSFDAGYLAGFGILASSWFVFCEFLLSYNLAKLWRAITTEGCADLAGAWPHRHALVVWAGRLLLPAPYIAGLYGWLRLHPNPSVSTWAFSVPIVVWVLMALGWLAAEKGRW